MIDPYIQDLMTAMAESGFRLPDPLNAVTLRATLDVPMPAPPVEIAERRDLNLGDGMGGRLYHPAVGEILPVLLFFHGGGWVHGTLDTHDRMAAALAFGANCAVVSVDYRMAPESPFPAAWDDAVRALDWVRAHADDLGIDASRIAVGGDSAGGNIAAALAQKVAGDASVVHQLLFYPALDGRCGSASYEQEQPGFLTPSQMRWYWDQYATGPLRDDPRASPLLGEISSGLAAATIIIADNDPLHDEGVAYAQALEAAGVPVRLHDFPGAIHGFVSLFGMIPVADEALQVAVSALRDALASRAEAAG